jgi:hypothetical protein
VPVDVQKLAHRFKQLEAESASFRATCDQIDKYIMPRVGGTSTGHKTSTEGTATWKDPDVWDFTAPVALAKLAAHIHTGVMPTSACSRSRP